MDQEEEGVNAQEKTEEPGKDDEETETVSVVVESPERQQMTNDQEPVKKYDNSPLDEIAALRDESEEVHPEEYQTDSVAAAEVRNSSNDF